MSALSLKVLAICEPRWSRWRKGDHKHSPCAGCPLLSPCTAPLQGALSHASIDAYAEKLNAAAAAVEMP